MSPDDKTSFGTRRLQQERDLFLQLLELSHTDEIVPLLQRALTLAVEATGAERGHIHVFSPDGYKDEWSMVLNCSASEGQEMRALVSRGIEAAVLRERRLIHTTSAELDPRFSEFESVRGLQAIMCAPLGHQDPVGVLYLYGTSNGRFFAESDRDLAEVFARHLGPAVRFLAALERQKQRQDFTAPWRSRLNVPNLVGRSMAMAETLEFIASVARLNVGVLLTGASGTGKSAIARSIHENGPRRSAPFVELNCSAIPENLTESELFGARAGAYTGASTNLSGKVDAAEGGTLFLDEVALLSQAAQAKLLTFLERKEYFPVGGTTVRKANVRIIAATNANLEESVADGSFRSDLYYRLNVVPFRVPSLSERLEDIEELADHFRDAMAELESMPKLVFSAQARAALRTMPWDGNLRELAHTVETGLFHAATKRAEQIEVQHLFPQARTPHVEDRTYQQAMRQCQKHILTDALEREGGSVAKAAKRLDIARSHFYNLMDTLDMKNKKKT